MKADDHYLICGDFNSIPKSNLVKMILERKLPDKENMESVISEENWKIMLETYPNFVNYLEKYDIDNSYCYYGQIIGNANLLYPKYTNYTQNFKEVLDHIFFSKNSYKIL